MKEAGASIRWPSLGKAAPVSIILAASIPLAFLLCHPFVSPADSNTAHFAQPARNLLRYGPIATHLGLVVDAGGAAPGGFTWNTHHPPLMAVGAAGVFALLGVSEATARLYPAICSLGSALLLFFIWRRHRGDGPAAFAAIMMCTLPGFGHFGKMLGEEAPTLFFSLLAILLYRRKQFGWLFGVYAVSCLSGWAGFYVGALLILDASLNQAREAPSAWRLRFGIGLTALAAFALIVAQIYLVAGSLAPLTGAARHRLTGSATGRNLPVAGDPWVHREAGHLARVFGLEAAPAALAGALAGLMALARRRADREAIATLVILGGIGVAHPLIFRWAAYYHDWLLFHLMPLGAIAMAEGYLLGAGATGALLKAVRLHAMAMPVSAVILVVATAHRAAVCGRDLTLLAADQAGYVAPMLGPEIARRVPEDYPIMTNFPDLNPTLRFYADRRITVVRGKDQFERLALAHRHPLYVRDLNIGIEPALEQTLDRLTGTGVAAFRLHDLREGSGSDTGIDAVAPETGRSVQRAELDARFGDIVRLTGYEVFAPTAPPDRLPLWRRFLGTLREPLSRAPIIEVISSWSVLDPNLPDGTIMVALSCEQPGGAARSLPLLTLPEMRHPALINWRGRPSFRIHSAFLIPSGSPRGEYVVTFGANQRGRLIRPVLPGPPRPMLKVVAARIAPFG